MNIKQDQELKSETNCNFLAQFVEKLRLNKGKGKYNFFVIFRKKRTFLTYDYNISAFLESIFKSTMGFGRNFYKGFNLRPTATF